MKKLRSMTAVKVFVVFLLTVCVIGVPFLGIIFIYSINQCQEVNQISDFFNYQYAESMEFSNDVNLRLTQLTEYLKLKEILETNGKLDYDKVAAEVYSLEGKEEYTIRELLEYNENNYGFYPETVAPSRKLLPNFSGVSFSGMVRGIYPVTKSEDGETVKIGEVEQTEFIADFTKEENKVFLDLEEADQFYQALWGTQTETTDNDNEEITEFLNSISDKLGKEGTNHIASDKVQINLLSDAAYCMTYYVAYYQYYQEIFEKSPDLLYWIFVPGREACTNIKKEKLGDNPKEKFSGIVPMGEIWYQNNAQMETTISNLQDSRVQMAKLEKLFLESEKEKFYVHIAIPDNEKNSMFCVKQEKLEKIYHMVPVYVVILIGMGMIILLCICFLFYVAGHKAGYEGIYLNQFDRWYTEIAAGLCLSAGIFCTAMAWDLLDNITAYEEIICIFLWGFLDYIIALYSFASLARRIKARTLWKNSLTCRILSNMKRYTAYMLIAVMQMWERRSVGKKVILAYIGGGCWEFYYPSCFGFTCRRVGLWR